MINVKSNNNHHLSNNGGNMSEFKHREAFAVMTYQCEGCQSLFRVWNSRDGVTPFSIGSPCCQDGRTLARHVHFGLDFQRLELPTDMPIVRVFIDMTKDKAQELAERRFELHGEKMMKKYPHLREIGKEALIQNDAKSLFGEGANPCTLTTSEYLEGKEV